MKIIDLISLYPAINRFIVLSQHNKHFHQGMSQNEDVKLCQRVFLLFKSTNPVLFDIINFTATITQASCLFIKVVNFHQMLSVPSFFFFPRQEMSTLCGTSNGCQVADQQNTEIQASIILLYENVFIDLNQPKGETANYNRNVFTLCNAIWIICETVSHLSNSFTFLYYTIKYKMSRRVCLRCMPQGRGNEQTYNY